MTGRPYPSFTFSLVTEKEREIPIVVMTQDSMSSFSELKRKESKIKRWSFSEPSIVSLCLGTDQPSNLFVFGKDTRLLVTFLFVDVTIEYLRFLWINYGSEVSFDGGKTDERVPSTTTVSRRYTSLRDEPMFSFL